MSYNKTTWQTGDVVTAEKLNNAEQGIYTLSQRLPDPSNSNWGKNVQVVRNYAKGRVIAHQQTISNTSSSIQQKAISVDDYSILESSPGIIVDCTDNSNSFSTYARNLGGWYETPGRSLQYNGNSLTITVYGQQTITVTIYEAVPQQSYQLYDDYDIIIDMYDSTSGYIDLVKGDYDSLINKIVSKEPLKGVLSLYGHYMYEEVASQYNLNFSRLQEDGTLSVNFTLEASAASDMSNSISISTICFNVWKEEGNTYAEKTDVHSVTFSNTLSTLSNKWFLSGFTSGASYVTLPAGVLWKVCAVGSNSTDYIEALVYRASTPTVSVIAKGSNLNLQSASSYRIQFSQTTSRSYHWACIRLN